MAVVFIKNVHGNIVTLPEVYPGLNWVHTNFITNCHVSPFMCDRSYRATWNEKLESLWKQGVITFTATTWLRPPPTPTSSLM